MSGWTLYPSPYTRGHVTGVISPQNVLVDGMPCLVRDLCPVIGLDTSESGSDSGFSTQSVRMITVNEVCDDPLEVNTAYATDDTSADESSEEEVPLPRRSARRKRPARVIICVIMKSRGAGIERQNPQPVVAVEPTGVRRSKRQRQSCCICRRNSRRLREFGNRPRLDKKTSGEPSERGK